MTHETSPSVAQDAVSEGARRLRAEGAAASLADARSDLSRAEVGGSRPGGGAAPEGTRAARPSDGLVYVSGAFRTAADASVSVFDHGLLYGDGVFEGIRAYNGRVFKLERHIERLFDSAKAIRLEIPHTPADVCDIVVETCRRNGISDGYIRLVVTRGPGDLGIDPRKCPQAELIVIVRPTLTMYRAASAGIRVITSTFRRNAPDATSPSIKSLNYLNNILARI